MELTPDQIDRYSRNLLLAGVGAEGQKRLLRSSVACVGAGGLGSAVLCYLAAAGVGRIGIVDGDRLELSNLNRQIIHTTRELGRPKAESARERIRALNPDVAVEIYPERLVNENVRGILERYEAVVDASDNFPTRFLLNDACFHARKPLFFGSAVGFEGQATVFFAARTDTDSHGRTRTNEGIGIEGPCYRCIFPDLPPPGMAPAAVDIGILGAVAGTIGAIQAIECIKHLAGIGAGLNGRLLIFDGLHMAFRQIKLKANPRCRLCG